MPEIPCKFVKRTGEREYLRVFWGDWNQIKPEEHSGWSYHDAQVKVRDILDPNSNLAIHTVSDFEYLAHILDWPKKCTHCSEVVPPRGTPNTHYDLFYEALYDDPPRLLEPGDIWSTPWIHDAPDSYGVKLPNGSDWYTYLIASNCNHPEMHETRDGVNYYTDHKCWTTTGEPPNLDVNPSILSCKDSPKEWHGYLRNGKLTW